MDILLEKPKPNLVKKFWYVIPIVAMITMIGYFKSWFGEASFIVAKDHVRTAQVQRGEFTIAVRANGLLKARDVRWLATQVDGRVSQVFAKAGEKVSPDTPLLQLENPQLVRQLQQTRWELEALKAEQQAELVAMESQLMSLENNVLEAEFAYKSSKLKLDAENNLLQRGKGSISQLDFQRTQLNVEQQYKLWQSQMQRLEKMQENLASKRIAQKARLDVLQNQLVFAQEQVEQLTLRAHFEGVLQNISIEQGQQITAGTSVALIADHHSLMAELMVQELQIQNIQQGQSVVIDTRLSTIAGKVTRIDPSVQNGMVLVDVELQHPMPAEARPDLNVEGVVETAKIENTLFVQRPFSSVQQSDSLLYKLSNDQQFAMQTQVSLGKSSVRYVQITGGLNEGDTVVISDTSKWLPHSQILLN